MAAEFEHLGGAFSGGEGELCGEEREIEAEIAGGCDAAAGLRVEQTVAGDLELAGCEREKLAHDLIVARPLGGVSPAGWGGGGR